MKTYSSKSISNCLRTLAFAVAGALCALLSTLTLAAYGWDMGETEGLVKLGVALGVFLAAVLLGSAVRRTFRWLKYNTLLKRRIRL